MSKYTENFPNLSTCDFDTIMCQLRQVCGADPSGLINAQFLSRPTTAKDIALLLHITYELFQSQAELQKQFVELYTFVKDFFENLDLQEEVNEWLDNALSTGELQQIIEELLLNTYLKIYPSMNKLLLSDTLYNGQVIKTLGYYEEGDGGSALYIIENENSDKIQVKLKNNLYASYISQDYYSAQFGILGNNEDQNTAALNNVIGKLDKLVINKPFSMKSIEINKPIFIYGINHETGITITPTESYGILISANRVSIENLYIYTKLPCDCLQIEGKYITINNCKLNGLNTSATSIGVNIGKNGLTWGIHILNTDIRSFNKSARINGNNIIFNNSYMLASDNSVDYNISIINGENIVISNCDIEKGQGHIDMNDGSFVLQNSYIEGSSIVNTFKIDGGHAVIKNNYMHESIVRFNSDVAKIELLDNMVDKSIETSYFCIPLGKNLKYMVLKNNIFMDTGISTQVADAYNGKIPRVKNPESNLWTNAESYGYVSIENENGWAVNPSTHWPVNIYRSPALPNV